MRKKFLLISLLIEGENYSSRLTIQKFWQYYLLKHNLVKSVNRLISFNSMELDNVLPMQ